MLAIESRIAARTRQRLLMYLPPDQRRSWLEAERKRNLKDLTEAKRDLLAKMAPEALAKLVLACPEAIMAL